MIAVRTERNRQERNGDGENIGNSGDVLMTLMVLSMTLSMVLSLVLS